MAARISAMVLMGVLAQFIPGWIMKKKNKTDLAGKKKIIVSRILAEPLSDLRFSWFSWKKIWSAVCF
jgi:hypothetical protein